MHHRIKAFLRTYGRTGLLAAAALMAGVVLFGRAALFAHWAATALLVLTLPVLWSELRPMLEGTALSDAPWALRLRRGLPYVAVMAGTLVSLGPVALLDMPVSQDHVNHYFGTHILVREMIPSGRFFGWTDSLGTGYPFGDIYHTAGYLVTGLLHLVSFGLIPLDASYAFGIVLTWCLSAAAVTALTRRMAGPLGAALAGLLFTLDVGGDREGGWGYAMFHGVWPQRLGLGVWLFALLALIRLAERPTTRRLAAAVLLVGAALWTHPMNGVTLLLAGMVMLGVQLFTRHRSATSAPLVWQIAALAGGGLIGMAWLIRMMVNGDVVYAFPSRWEPVNALVAQFLDGALFSHQLLPAAVLALIGIAYGLIRGDRFTRMGLGILALLLLVGSMDLLIGSDLGLAGGGLGLMQYRRFSIPAKPFYYAFAGVGLSVVWRGITAGRRGQPGHALLDDSLGGRILGAALLAPFLFGLVSALPGLVRGPAARPLTRGATGEAQALVEIERVLAEERGRCKGPCRAVYWEKPGHGGLYPVIAFADLGYQWLPMLKLPANNFDYQGVATRVDAMQMLGATVAVSKWKQTDPGLVLLGRFGRHYVYRILDADVPQASLPGGRATLVSRGPESREYRIEGLTGRAPLTLHMAPYKKWRAVQDGARLPTRRERREGVYVTVIEDVGPGPLRLEYEDSAVERLFYVLGWIAIGLCVIGLVWRPSPLPAGWSARTDRFVGRLLCIGYAAIAIGAPVAVVAGGAVAANRNWLRGETPGVTLLSVLHRTGPTDIVLEPSNVCVRPYTRDPGWDCSEADFAPRLVPAARRGGKVPSCLSVGVPEGGEMTLRFSAPAGTARIKGMLHPDKGVAVTAVASTGDGEGWKRTISGTTPFDLKTDGGAVFTVTFEAKKRTRVCLEAVALGDR